MHAIPLTFVSASSASSLLLDLYNSDDFWKEINKEYSFYKPKFLETNISLHTTELSRLHCDKKHVQNIPTFSTNCIPFQFH